jgi:hypothetical protein
MNNMHSIRKMFHRTGRGMKRAREFLSGISVGRLGCDVIVWDGVRREGKGWDGLGGKCGGSRGFDSHQLNCVFLF